MCKEGSFVAFFPLRQTGWCMNGAVCIVCYCSRFFGVRGTSWLVGNQSGNLLFQSVLVFWLHNWCIKTILLSSSLAGMEHCSNGLLGECVSHLS